MNPKIVFAFALLAIVHQAQSACLCNFGEGKDICSSGKCAPLVIRPANLPKINVETYSKPRVVCQTIGGGVLNPFKPVPNPCSCHQSVVTPALVPRPVCTACSEKSSCSHSSSSASSASSGCGTVVGGNYGQFVVEESGPTAAAVDPVSLALAYKQQNRACGISEGRLAYGFRKLPVELVDERAQKPEIDEKSLYELNGQIVELKKIGCGPKVSVDDEALAELDAIEKFDELEQGGEASHIKSLRYKDVGFGIANVKTVPFREVVGVVEANPQPVAEVRTCDDGYRAGNVIFKNVQQPETYSAGAGVPADCGDSDEDYRPFYKYSSSSSSGSKSHNCHQCRHSKISY